SGMYQSKSSGLKPFNPAMMAWQMTIGTTPDAVMTIAMRARTELDQGSLLIFPYFIPENRRKGQSSSNLSISSCTSPLETRQEPLYMDVPPSRSEYRPPASSAIIFIGARSQGWTPVSSAASALPQKT